MRNIQFDNNGSPQPSGVYPVDKEEWAVFFKNIDDKSIRKLLIEKWHLFVNDLKNYVTPDIWKQWIGGSFTTLKQNPSDIDFVNIIDHDSLKEILQNPGPYFRSKNGVNDSKQHYNLDSFVVAQYPASHANNKITQKELAYWKKWFGTDRHGVKRTVFEVVICEQ